MKNISCKFCENSENLKIEEAYNRDRLINEQFDIYVETDHLGIDFKNTEAHGFYIDIFYCPMCGKCLKELEE